MLIRDKNRLRDLTNSRTLTLSHSHIALSASQPHQFTNPNAISVLNRYLTLTKSLLNRLLNRTESLLLLTESVAESSKKTPVPVKKAKFVTPEKTGMDRSWMKANRLWCTCMLRLSLAKNNSSLKKPTWLFPKTRVQPNGNDCGYYVMKNMIDIVSTSITKNWNEVFNDSTALTEDDLYELRNCWATCFLDLFNPKNDYDDVAEEGS
ncbi:hypothetical protein P8452_36863 [Trifolium repens]|nr:hypothetical protein P8452_36863 [Trifolium repens]